MILGLGSACGGRFFGWQWQVAQPAFNRFDARRSPDSDLSVAQPQSGQVSTYTTNMVDVSADPGMP